MRRRKSRYLSGKGIEILKTGIKPAVLFSVLLALYLAGCTTGSEVPSEPRMIPGDLSIYFSVSPPESRDLVLKLLESGMDPEKAEKLIDQTDRVYGGFSESPLPAEIFLAAAGDYPSGSMKLGLTFSKEWAHHKEPASYWVNSRGMEIAVPDSRWILVSTGRIGEMLSLMENEPSTGDLSAIPGPVIDELERGDIVLLGSSLPPFAKIGEILREDNLDSWTFILNRESDGDYGGSLSIDFSNERTARVFGTTLKLFRMAGGSEQDPLNRKLMEGKYSREDETVFLSEMEFTQDELVELTERFL